MSFVPRTPSTFAAGRAILIFAAALAVTSCCGASGGRCAVTISGASGAGAATETQAAPNGRTPAETSAARKPLVTIPADTLHGHVIPDPYRWLEDFESQRAQRWIEEQEEATRAILDNVAARDSIRTKLGELFEIPHLGSVWLRGERLFLVKRGSDQEQPVLYVQEGAAGEPRKLIDPETLGNESPVTLDWWFPSEDGDLLAYGTSVGGSERSTLRVLDVETGDALPDTIPRTRMCSLSWTPDASAFYYTRFPAPGEVPDEELFFHRKVYYHKLGTDYRGDPMVFGEGLDMRAWTGVSVSTNGRFLIGYAYYGSSRNDLYVRDLEDEDGDWVPVVEGLDARSYGIPIGNDFYMLTRLDAPNGRIVHVDLTNPDPSAWKVLVPESEHSIRSFAYADGRLLVNRLEDAHDRVDIFTEEGEHVDMLRLPDMASVADWTADRRHPFVFLNLSSYLMPPTIVRHDLDTGLSSTHMAVEAPIDVSAYVTRQAWYPSRDGTMISMFLVHGRDIALDGENPTILTGYGGFDIPMTPGFARNRYLWLEQGGVYAVPNLRGGGEYGEEWHRA
ncbi:MAG: prolyl oligopeptidase family serine peptidase, partial [Candidatus Eisenbacteria bacterium]|nr:prolyl oligopeptidase family serine peptidase [Candidatus Eisenbacteria bacterium]